MSAVLYGSDAIRHVEDQWGQSARVSLQRVTMYPATTPAGVDLAGMVERRLAEIEPGGVLFTAPKGGWLRRSNWGRAVWDRAADDVGWPRDDDGTWRWTFHSLRHVFATWALHDVRIPMEDVSRLLGHSSTRLTGFVSTATPME